MDTCDICHEMCQPIAFEHENGETEAICDSCYDGNIDAGLTEPKFAHEA